MLKRTSHALAVTLALLALAGCGAAHNSSGASSQSGPTSVSLGGTPSTSSAPEASTVAGTATPGMVPLSTNLGSTPSVVQGTQHP